MSTPNREAEIRKRALYFGTVPSHAARCYAEDVAWLLEQLAQAREDGQRWHDDQGHASVMLAVARMIDEGCPHHD